jgi:O-antigen/teichoic acid export membrane protein
MSKRHRIKAFIAPKLRTVIHFLLAQGLTMAGNLAYGFLCLRMLNITDYAMYSVVFGFLGSLTVLLNAGVSNTLAPLVAEEVNNLPLIADFTASIRNIALKLYVIVAPIAMIFFVTLTKRQKWGWTVIIQMVLALGTAAWFARVSASYGAVLLLLRDRTRYYRIQVVGGLGSLALLIFCYLSHLLNIYTAIALNVAQITYYAAAYYRRARQLLIVKGQSSHLKQKAIIRLSLPNLPSIIFYAVQGQISVLLITAFGKDPASIAGIGALGRLGQLFVLFAQINPVLVEPFFAKLPIGRLKRLYGAGVLAVGGFAFLASAFAFLFPEAFLWILGPKYQDLRIEVGLAIVGSSIRFLNGFMWTVNSSRRFVYWGNNLSIIIGTLTVQLLFLWKADLSTVRTVLILNIATAVVEMLSIGSGAIYGFWHGPQKIVNV